MEILENIEVENLTLFIRDKEILVIGDLHLGFEESLNRQGVMMPRFLFDDIMKMLKKVIEKNNIKKIVIVGDIKHEFGTISDQEWRHVLQLIDFLREKGELIVVKGNHDVILDPITKKRNVKVREHYEEGKVLFAHGDCIIEGDYDVVIIGHEHPAVSFKGRPTQKYKCFLKGRYEKSKIIVMPSLNLISIGSDITKGNFLSPYLKKAKSLEVYIVEDKVYKFGRLEDLD